MNHTHGNYIDGQWVCGSGSMESRSPSDRSDVIGRYARAELADVDNAASAARKAFPAWMESSPQVRFDLLDAVGTRLLESVDSLGSLVAREEGKTLADARAEITKAGQIFKFFAGEAVRMNGELTRSLRSGIDVCVEREPIGTVGVISPWNFPVSIPAWKTAPALAYGNCVILKPSELTNASAHAFATILHEAGVPSGVFQLLMGDGRAIGADLVANESVDAISFTGSSVTGQRIAAAAHERGIRLQMELGGKNPLVVLADADLDRAVDAALKGAYFAAGQRCTASSRLIVEAGIHNEFVDRLVDRIGRLRVGHALDPASDIGPMVSAVQRDRVLHYVALGKQEGAHLLFGGKPLDRPTEGYFLEPALFVESHMGQRINTEEIFGPLATVIRAACLDEAIEIANATPFGLSAGIFTSSLASARRYTRRSRAGMVMVNVATAGSDYHVPFGGRGASAYGPKEMGRAALEFYTQTKTMYVAA